MNFNVITYFCSEYENKGCEEKKMVDTPQDEVEKLRKLRTALESRLTAIEEEQKTVEEGMEILRQKVAIRELEESVRRRQQELAGLRLEKKRLADETNDQ
jgi:hypothetical protein